MIDIKIDNEIVYVDVEKEGRHFKKITSLDTFRKTVGVVETSYDSGWLPGKTGVKRILENTTQQKVVYIHPGGRVKVRYTDNWYPYYTDDHGYTEEDYTNVGFSRKENMDDDRYETYIRDYWHTILNKLYEQGKYPENQLYNIVVPDAVIIGSKAAEAKHWKIRLFSLGHNTLLTGREELFEYPMPNIYTGQGRICWGDNEFQTNFEGIQPFQGYFPAFISSSFNSDLSDGRIVSDQSIVRIWKQMDRMLEEGATNEQVYKLYEGRFRTTGETIKTYI